MFSCGSSPIRRGEEKEYESRVNNMTLEALRAGEIQFAWISFSETTGSLWFHQYRPVVDGRVIRGTSEAVPAAIVEIFPEVADNRYFVAETGRIGCGIYVGQEEGVFYPDSWNGRSIVEFCGENREMRRWEQPAISDLSTGQIIALMERKEGLAESGINFGLRVSGAEEELIRRSETARGQASQATAWLASNFQKEDAWAIDWLKRAVLGNRAQEFRQSFAGTSAVHFTEQQAVTGDWKEWEWLPAIPKERIAVLLSGDRRIVVAPQGSRDQHGRPDRLFCAEDLKKVPGGDGLYRIREDGRMDIFLRRGSRGTGPVGWLWVLINPKARASEAVEAALDPLDNYGALRGVDAMYTPIFARIARAHAKARGWWQEVSTKGNMYGDCIQIAINGPRSE
jgi:hypothetical protein